MDLTWVDRMLYGITMTDLESDEGWWETSKGAIFGARKLVELKAEIARRYGPTEESKHQGNGSNWAGAPWAEEKAW